VIDFLFIKNTKVNFFFLPKIKLLFFFIIFQRDYF
jgi:hypothetical protein